jgi:hypothetical protein
MTLLFTPSTPDQALSLLNNLLTHGHGQKIVVCSAAFLWSRQLAERVAKDTGSEVRKDPDQTKLTLGTNEARFRPVGDTSRIRGIRPDVLVVVTEAVPKEMLELLVAGTASVVTSPRGPATGGVVPSDDVPAMLSPGESFIRPDQFDAVRSKLRELNDRPVEEDVKPDFEVNG